VTEIPEHLLKRSRERRSALGLGDEGATSESASVTPGTTPAATQSTSPQSASPAATGPAPRAGLAARAEATPAQPAMVHPTVVAATKRRKVPFWAMAALSLMPVWVFMYARALTQTTEVSAGPVGLGAEIYGNCASCHGGAGGGGVGYAFTGGEILKTYPNIEDMIRFVYHGSGAYTIAGVEIPGDPNREGGPHRTGALGVMPQFGATAGGGLTDYELLSVICHERYTLGGADPTSEEWSEEYQTWCSADSEVYAGLQSGMFSLADVDQFVDGVIAIGTDPVPGRTAGDR
jgi:mono/diheme cytochrome c family protein